MAISYTWSINELECYPAYASQFDVVFRVGWSYSGKDENNIGSSRGGTTDVTYVAGSAFTPLANLTEAQVLGWIRPTISDEKIVEMELGIVGDIDWQRSQSKANNSVSPPLPWERPVG